MQHVAVLHAIIGLFIPLFMVSLLTRYFGAKRSCSEGLAAWKFAHFAGVVFTVPYVLFASFLGPEIPSLLGGLIALLCAVLAAKKRYLQPANVWSFPGESHWQEHWTGETLQRDRHISGAPLPIWRAFVPYILIGLLLVLTRLPELPLREYLSGFRLHTGPIIGTDISASINFVYLPGSVFILVVFLCLPLFSITGEQVLGALKSTGHAFTNAALVLIFAVPMVRIFIRSDFNSAGLDSMPIELAQTIAQFTGQAWLLFAACIGALGAFIGGSNTISNLTFSLFQFGVGIKSGLSPIVIVALQAVGGAAGEMICIHNIVAASATCGLSGQEGTLIRKTIIPTLYYLIAAGLAGVVVLYLF